MPTKIKLSTKRNYTKKKSTKLKGGWGEPIQIMPMKHFNSVKRKKKDKKDKKQKKVKKVKVKKQKGGWGGKPRFYTSN